MFAGVVPLDCAFENVRVRLGGFVIPRSVGVVLRLLECFSSTFVLLKSTTCAAPRLDCERMPYGDGGRRCRSFLRCLSAGAPAEEDGRDEVSQAEWFPLSLHGLAWARSELR